MSRHTEPLTYRVSADQMRVHIECNGVLVATAYTIPDARLYAAAPELLAALEALVKVDAEDGADDEYLRVARAAIAKARGGE